MGPDREFHRIVLGYVNQVFQQISGINLITYYAATIYERDINLGGTASRALAAADRTGYFLASWLAVPTIERYGRRSLMIFGAAGMSVTMILLIGTDYMAPYDIEIGNRSSCPPSRVQHLLRHRLARHDMGSSLPFSPKTLTTTLSSVPPKSSCSKSAHPQTASPRPPIGSSTSHRNDHAHRL